MIELKCVDRFPMNTSPNAELPSSRRPLPLSSTQFSEAQSRVERIVHKFQIPEPVY